MSPALLQVLRKACSSPNLKNTSMGRVGAQLARTRHSYPGMWGSPAWSPPKGVASLGVLGTEPMGQLSKGCQSLECFGLAGSLPGGPALRGMSPELAPGPSPVSDNMGSTELIRFLSKGSSTHALESVN